MITIVVTIPLRLHIPSGDRRRQQVMSKHQRAATYPAFAEWLVDAARHTQNQNTPPHHPMKITTNHPASVHGVPVVLDDNGEPLSHAQGLKAARKALGWSTADLGEAVGASKRTVEAWEQGKAESAAAMNVLKDALEKIRGKTQVND